MAGNRLYFDSGRRYFGSDGAKLSLGVLFYFLVFGNISVFSSYSYFDLPRPEAPYSTILILLSIPVFSFDRLSTYFGYCRQTSKSVPHFMFFTTEPNQALEPTTLSVTLCAPSRTDRAS